MRKGRKPITLPAGILILLFTLMPLGGCQQDNRNFQRQLSAADSLMQTDADVRRHINGQNKSFYIYFNGTITIQP